MTGEIDPVRIVDDAIEDCVGVCGIADQFVPFVDWDLAGDDRRSAAVAFFENLEQIVTSGGIERLEAQSSRMSNCTPPTDRWTTVAAGQREVARSLLR